MAERTDETQSPFHPQALQSPALPAGGVVSPPSKLQIKGKMKGMLQENGLLQVTSKTMTRDTYSFYKRKIFLRLAIRQKNYKPLASLFLRLNQTNRNFLKFSKAFEVLILSVRESKLNNLDRSILNHSLYRWKIDLQRDCPAFCLFEGRWWAGAPFTANICQNILHKKTGSGDSCSQDSGLDTWLRQIILKKKKKKK